MIDSVPGAQTGSWCPGRWPSAEITASLPATAGSIAGAAHRESLRAQNVGPHQVNEAVIGFFRAEVEASRIDTSPDLYAAAGLLVGACMQHAFLGHMGWAARRADEEAAQSFARTVIQGLSPDGGSA